jgi:hypothetical protein
VLFCRDQGLFTARLVALDGSKFRAAASAKRIMGRREIAEEAARLDRRIADYLAGLDESDAREPDETPSATVAALQALRSRRAELDRLAAQLDSEERNTLVEGEPDARPMGIGASRKPPSYNMQTAVDAETGLIVHHEVTTEPTDNRLLHPMAKATKDAVKAATLTVVADAGYLPELGLIAYLSACGLLLAIGLNFLSPTCHRPSPLQFAAGTQFSVWRAATGSYSVWFLISLVQRTGQGPVNLCHKRRTPWRPFEPERRSASAPSAPVLSLIFNYLVRTIESLVPCEPSAAPLTVRKPRAAKPLPGLTFR